MLPARPIKRERRFSESAVPSLLAFQQQDAHKKREHWFDIFTEDGKKFKNLATARVTLSKDALVQDLKNAVKAELASSNYLRDVPAAKLKVYKGLTSMRNKEEALDASSSLSQLKCSLYDRLAVVVPNDGIEVAGKEGLSTLTKASLERKSVSQRNSVASIARSSVSSAKGSVGRRAQACDSLAENYFYPLSFEEWNRIREEAATKLKKLDQQKRRVTFEGLS
jgi:hypothetical protein